jgi:hypothetical protein
MPNLLSKKQKYANLSLHFTAKSSLSHHVVRRGVASDISKGELTEQLIWSFFQPAGMSLCGLCLCFRYGLRNFSLQKATEKPKKYSSTHLIAPLQHHRIIALII